MRVAKLNLIIVAGILSMTTLARAEDGVDGSIQVRSVAEIEGSATEITLADIMVGRGLSETALAELNKVRLADTPSAGESRTFTALGIEQVFRPHLREIEAATGEHISLRVPTRVTVVRKKFRLVPDDVEAAIKTQLKEFCADCTFEISALQLPVFTTPIPAAAKWEVKTRSELPKGAFSYALEISGDETAKRVYWVTGQLAIRRKVPVAARSIEIGEHLRPEDFNYQSKDVTFANDTAPSEAELTLSVAARQISAGTIVWRSNLKRELAVKVGDIVKVAAGDGGWQVLIDGISQTAGYIGDMVKVKIPRTQKMVSGLLTERGLVEVH